MVKLGQQVDISWMKKLATTCDNGDPAWLEKALQETRLRMNEEGARAESAVALGGQRMTTASPPPPDYVIDRPFLAWWGKPDLPIPIFVGYITPENWVNPGDIKQPF